MSVDEAQLNRWAKAPSETEETKCQQTVSRVTNAIKKRFGNDVSIFLQGSYKNRTNVKLDSDVDIVVLHEGYYFPDISFLSDTDKEQYWKDFKGSDYKYADFKNDVQKILEEEFDYGEVERKNKCIKVNKNSYRVDADVVPCFSHRRFNSLYSTSAEGIKLIADNGDIVTSFPKQHYDNGVDKNKNTNLKYKSLVRILKNARNDLIGNEIINNDDMPSFFLECLVWNVLDHKFDKYSYKDTSKAVITDIWNDMQDTKKAFEYAEVSDLKWLFKGHKDIRTPEQAKVFMEKVWRYLF